MSGIEPRGNKHEKNYKERLLELRSELTKAITYDIVTPELFQGQMIQILNGIEGIKIKSQREIERLTHQIGEEHGRMKACNDMGDLIVNIVAAFNTQEVRRLEEMAALAKEREEAEKVDETVTAVVETPLEKVTTKQVEKIAEKLSGVSTDIPGVRIIPSGKSPKK
jgi:hypothetical protein